MESYKSVVCPPWEETGVTLVIATLKICTRFKIELEQAAGMSVWNGSEEKSW